MSIDTEIAEIRLLNHLEDHGNIEQFLWGKPLPVDLTEMYTLLRSKYFEEKIPLISESFVCDFQELPFAISGITITTALAAQLNIKMGIRINSRIRDFRSEVTVVLLHEMIHVSGIEDHDEDFKAAIKALWNKGAYLNPLLL